MSDFLYILDSAWDKWFLPIFPGSATVYLFSSPSLSISPGYSLCPYNLHTSCDCLRDFTVIPFLLF